jgi:hypothetical protein
MAIHRQSAQSKQAVLIKQSFLANGVLVDPTIYPVATAWLPEGTAPSVGTTWVTADWETIGPSTWAVRTYVGPGGAVVLPASDIPYVPFAKITTPTEIIVDSSTDRLEVY